MLWKLLEASLFCISSGEVPSGGKRNEEVAGQPGSKGRRLRIRGDGEDRALERG